MNLNKVSAFTLKGADLHSESIGGGGGAGGADGADNRDVH